MAHIAHNRLTSVLLTSSILALLVPFASSASAWKPNTHSYRSTALTLEGKIEKDRAHKNSFDLVTMGKRPVRYEVSGNAVGKQLASKVGDEVRAKGTVMHEHGRLVLNVHSYEVESAN